MIKKVAKIKIKKVWDSVLNIQFTFIILTKILIFFII